MIVDLLRLIILKFRDVCLPPSNPYASHGSLPKFTTYEAKHMLILLLEGTSFSTCFFQLKAQTSFFSSMRHVAGIFSRYLNNKRLYIDHIWDGNYVIEACSKIVCHALSRYG